MTSDINELRRILAPMPADLRELVEAELHAGNSIVEISSKPPAPPAGLCVMLARPVTTTPRASSATVRFVERALTYYSGEFSDLRRMFFVIEPPRPPSVEPDMNAIRDELEARERAANADRFREGGLW